MPEILFRVADFVARVTSTDSPFLERLRAIFPCVPPPGSPVNVSYDVQIDRRLSPAKRHVVIRGGKGILHITAFYPSISVAIDTDVSRSLSEMAGSSWFIGGSSLSWKGDGLLLLGGDRFPRNRLALQLSARGCLLYGDDVTILKRPEHELVPYQKAVAVNRPRHSLVARQKAGGPFRDPEKQEVRYETPAYPARDQDPPTHVRFIFLLNSGQAAPLARHVSKGTAAAALLDRTAFGRGRDGNEVNEILTIVENATVFQLDCASSCVTASRVIEAIENPAVCPGNAHRNGDHVGWQ